MVPGAATHLVPEDKMRGRRPFEGCDLARLVITMTRRSRSLRQTAGASPEQLSDVAYSMAGRGESGCSLRMRSHHEFFP